MIAKLKRFSVVPVIILSLVVLSYVPTSTATIVHLLKNDPPILVDLRDLGTVLGEKEPDKSKVIIGRKPHIAYFAGLQYSMFPPGPKTVAELAAYCRDHDIDYIQYTGIEANYRPDVDSLYELNADHPGLELVYYNQYGAIYRVLNQ